MNEEQKRKLEQDFIDKTLNEKVFDTRFLSWPLAVVIVAFLAFMGFASKEDKCWIVEKVNGQKMLVDTCDGRVKELKVTVDPKID